MTRGPYRDGRIHVLSEMCSTCVFRPGNLMYLQEGRLKDLTEQNLERDSALPCHKTLDGDRAVCRGYFDAYWQKITPLRLAVGLDLVAEVPPPA